MTTYEPWCQPGGPLSPAAQAGMGIDLTEKSRECEEDARRMADCQRCAVVLPAGGGKTELIARAVKQNSAQGGCQLVLTHTHAGVAALRSRLQRLEVPRAAYRVHTLDGFALRLTRHYPVLACTTAVEPEGEEWDEVREGAAQVLRSRHLRRVVRESYSGLYVDEYQDCSTLQHGVVLRLGEELPTRIVGDPLQGIFEFAGIVDWGKEVDSEFPRLAVTNVPWRWLRTNPALGRRLELIRQALVEGTAFRLQDGAGLDWRPNSRENQVLACLHSITESRDVVALQKWAPQCHKLAKQLNGAFSSMEELACKDLLRAATTIDSAQDATSAAAFLQFAIGCMTNLPIGVSSALGLYRKGKRAQTTASRRDRGVYVALNTMADDPSPASFLTGMEALEGLPGTFIHRRECWYEMKRSLGILRSEPAITTLQEAVLQVRDRTRRLGRRSERRTISRTLLVKGLEYDHAIVVDADQFDDPRHLYVALTRGRSRVTVLSKSRDFHFQTVDCD